MKNPHSDPLDTMLEQALQSASHGLEGETFRIQLTERIAQQRRWMTLVRLLPAIMGLLAAVIVSLVARPKFDFQPSFSSLAPVWENCQPAVAWLMKPIPGTQNLLFLWILLTGVALVYSHWLANRESVMFRL